YDRRALGLARFRSCTGAAFVAALVWIPAPASPAFAADPISDFASDFYSYLPAAPDIKAPDFDFIPFWTDDLKKAKRAYKNGDFEHAIRIYRLAATYNHPAAQCALGDMQLKGEGMRQNAEQGLRWLMTAARKRYPPAETKLGDLYWTGEVVQRDRTRAIMWYILAQSTTRRGDAPEIYGRLDKMLSQSTEAERLEAEARATVWADQFPAGEDAIIGPE